MTNQPAANKLNPLEFVRQLENVASLEERVEMASAEYERRSNVSNALAQSPFAPCPRWASRIRDAITKSPHSQSAFDLQFQKKKKDLDTGVAEYTTAAKAFLTYVEQKGTTIDTTVDYVSSSYGHYYTVSIAVKEFKQASGQPALAMLQWVKAAGLIAAGKKAQSKRIQSFTLASTVKNTQPYIVGGDLKIRDKKGADDYLVVTGRYSLLDEQDYYPVLESIPFQYLTSHLRKLAHATNSLIDLFMPNGRSG